MNYTSRGFTQLENKFIESVLNDERSWGAKFKQVSEFTDPKIIDIETAVQEMLALIDYPSILDKDALSFIELSGIFFVQNHLINIGDFRITSHTYNILNNKDKLL